MRSGAAAPAEHARGNIQADDFAIRPDALRQEWEVLPRPAREIEDRRALHIRQMSSARVRKGRKIDSKTGS